MSFIPPRIGLGFDIHKFTEDRPLVLGGVIIPFYRGLEGHSDADVLIHAAMDALLGAAGLNDIGHYFPPSEDKWARISSLILLQEIGKLLEQAQWSIGNIDCTVLAEEPKIRSHIEDMKRKMSETLRIEPGQIGIKATTCETLGAIGRKEGIAAYAIALLYKNEINSKR